MPRNSIKPKSDFPLFSQPKLIKAVKLTSIPVNPIAETLQNPPTYKKSQDRGLLTKKPKAQKAPKVAGRLAFNDPRTVSTRQQSQQTNQNKIKNQNNKKNRDNINPKKDKKRCWGGGGRGGGGGGGGRAFETHSKCEQGPLEP